MTLRGALTHHRSALRASLKAEYGIDLRNPAVRWDDLADLVVWLPPGCALWRAVGGPLAWSMEMYGHSTTDLRLRELMWQNAGDKSKPRPEPWEPPELASEQDKREKHTQRRAERALERQRKRA